MDRDRNHGHLSITDEICSVGSVSRRIGIGTLLVVGIPLLAWAGVEAFSHPRNIYIFDAFPRWIGMSSLAAIAVAGVACFACWIATFVYRAWRSWDLRERLKNTAEDERRRILVPLCSHPTPEVRSLAAAMMQKIQVPNRPSISSREVVPAVVSGRGTEVAAGTACSPDREDESTPRAATAPGYRRIGFSGGGVFALAAIALTGAYMGMWPLFLSSQTTRVDDPRDWGRFNRDYVSLFLKLPPETMLVRGRYVRWGFLNSRVEVDFHLPRTRTPDEWIRSIAGDCRTERSSPRGPYLFSNFGVGQSNGDRIEYSPKTDIYSARAVSD